MNAMQKQNADIKMVIMAGGTGGHVFPALAAADVLRNQKVHIDWLGTPRGIENKLVPQAGIALHHLSVEGVRGKGVMGILKAPFLIVKAVLQARAVLKKIRPQVVLGFGGFASGPGGVAAKWLGIPLVIHEQNAIAGTTNKLLNKISNKTLAAFENAFVDGSVVGNPVRDAIVALPPGAQRLQERAAKKLPINILIVGGSLGAKAINELMPTTFGKMCESFASDQQLNIWHQTGKNHLQTTQADYAQHRISAKVVEFIDDMAEAYAWADLVICRAGALTVSEVMAAGVAAIFIPLPNAIDDHQTHNAFILVNANAAKSFAQRELTAEKLSAELTELLQIAIHQSRQNLIAMAQVASEFSKPLAAQAVAQACMSFVKQVEVSGA